MRPLRVLMVEDSALDAELLSRELTRGGFEVTSLRVETLEDMEGALGQRWDVIISDYAMPRFGAPQALVCMQARHLDLPFIIVSGLVNEEIAVAVMRAGAHDFMAKGNWARLVLAVERELREAGLRAERARMQEQLLVSDRMASVGTLAAGVAHEINNPLAALIANLEFVLEDVPQLAREVRAGADPAAREAAAARVTGLAAPLRDVAESAERVRRIVRDLRVFSRADEEVLGPVDVQHVLESSIRMAWNEIRHRARLVKDYAPVPAVQGNEGRLGQLFLNLIINAAQAIPDGQAERNEIRVATRALVDGRVLVEVRDSGSGMSAEVVARVFDPFFTTKPAGVGTGLGLAICHRIVSDLGGELEVESELGRGTVFRARLLAAAPGAAQPALPPQPQPPARASRRGRILVVDDEPALGLAVQRMLSAEHEVHVVTSAREALRRVGGGERFDVILCDLMMPVMTGMELHAELVRLAPAQADKVLFMTGGAFTARAREFLDKVRLPCVEKPFDVASIRQAVHDVLG